MRRFPARSIAVTFAIASLAACGESPMAPRAVVETPTDRTPEEVVAKAGKLVSLAPLSGFGASGVAAVNNRRETAGWNYTSGTTFHAILRSADGSTMTDLGTLAGGTGSIALAMNDSSSVVGFSYVPSGYHAFVSRLVGGTRTMTDLGTLTGGTRSAAYGINTAGTIVGFSTNASGKQFAVRWAPPLYLPENLGTLAGGASSFAYAINDSGTIVGFATNASGTNRAAKWTALKAITDLGALDGAAGSSTARAINSNGDIVGWSTTASGDYHAFKLVAGGSMTDLGSTGGPSYAFAISKAGQVVGWAQPSAGNEQALLWADGTTTDLGTTSKSSMAKAYAMSDNGRVVGTSGDQATIWFLDSNSPPIAKFAMAGHSKVDRAPENFDASTSSDADNDPLTYSWDFGDATSGSANTATGVTAQHLYTVKGNFTVTLTVSDWRGGTTMTSQVIRIN